MLGGSFFKSLKDAEYSIDSDDHRNGKKVFMNQLELAIQEIMKSGAIPYVIKGNPVYSFQIQDCTLNNKRFNLRNICNMSLTEYTKQFNEWDEYLTKLINKYSSIKVIDPALIICDSLKCHSEIRDTPLYRDGGHLNDVGSRLIGSIYIEKFGNPFNQGG